MPPHQYDQIYACSSLLSANVQRLNEVVLISGSIAALSIDLLTNQCRLLDLECCYRHTVKYMKCQGKDKDMRCSRWASGWQATAKKSASALPAFTTCKFPNPSLKCYQQKLPLPLPSLWAHTCSPLLLQQSFTSWLFIALVVRQVTHIETVQWMLMYVWEVWENFFHLHQLAWMLSADSGRYIFNHWSLDSMVAQWKILTLQLTLGWQN